MPTFIKTGFWEKTRKGYKEWLNLDQLIISLLPSGGIPTLQEVTNQGNETTNSLVINDTFELEKSFRVNNIVDNYYAELSNIGLLTSSPNGRISYFANGYIELADTNDKNSQTLLLTNDSVNFGVGMKLSNSEVLNTVSLIYHPSYFEPQTPYNSPVVFYIPYKPEGAYTMATLDDIPVLLTSSDYANDALAAAGGILIGGLYHTAGVVKIRLT